MTMPMSAVKWILWALVQSMMGGVIVDAVIQMPRFVGPVVNVSVTVGREAVLSCSVENLGSYKVAWVRTQDQTILTIHTHVITRSHRIGLSHTDSWTWNLHIRTVKETDRGYYMCQINTDPMMSHNGYLQVVVPPDILDYPTSTDMVVREGANVTLQCAVTGFPKPTVTWQREDKNKISYGENLVDTIEGEILNLTKVNRLHMGAYLAIASNGIPPKVSRRILIIVHFPPMIWVPNQLVGAMEGDDVVLECHSEAYPKSINYWTKLNGDIILSATDGSPVDSYNGDKYEPILVDNTYKVTMRLTIRGVSASDYGTYVCLSKNSLGETDGQIKLYPLIPSTVAAKATTLPSSISAVSPEKGGKRLNSGGNKTKSSTRTSHRRESQHQETPIRNQQSNSVLRPPDDDSSGEIILARNSILGVGFILVSIYTRMIMTAAQSITRSSSSSL